MFENETPKNLKENRFSLWSGRAYLWINLHKIFGPSFIKQKFNLQMGLIPKRFNLIDKDRKASWIVKSNFSEWKSKNENLIFKTIGQIHNIASMEGSNWAQNNYTDCLIHTLRPPPCLLSVQCTLTLTKSVLSWRRLVTEYPEIRGGAATHPPLMAGPRLQTLASSREQRHKLAASQKRGGRGTFRIMYYLNVYWFT